MLNIIVCIKQILDPEAPVSTFKVDDDAKCVIQRGVPPVMSPFDENALEAALRLKDVHPTKITVLSMGNNLSKAVLSKSMAVGADELILLEDDIYKNLDSCATASILTAAIRKIGEYHLVLTGMQAADWDAGVAGSGIAEILGIPSVTVARKVEIVNNHVKIERVLPEGYQIIETSLPALITVSNSLGELRSANLREIMAAQKKPVIIWNSSDLGIDLSQMRKLELLKLFIPQKEVKCEMIHGATGEEMGINLALKLREKEII